MKKCCYCLLLIGWVLWTRTQSPTRDGWNAVTGFNNREQCAGNMREKLNMWRQFRDAVFDDNSVTFTENSTTLTYVCLADTEDPRRKPKPVAPRQPIS